MLIAYKKGIPWEYLLSLYKTSLILADLPDLSRM